MLSRRDCLKGMAGAAAWLAGCRAGAADPMPRSHTGFLADPIYRKHLTGPDFPENPGRLDAIEAHLERTGLRPRLVPFAASPPIDRWIAEIHTPAYIERVRRACAEGEDHIDSPDVPVSGRSAEVAGRADGDLLDLLDAIIGGHIANGFASIRPPGHHALADRAMGFCLFNNVAIAARYLQRRHRLARILIVDWDVHHGNGTQDAFWTDPTVFFFSVHQYPFYPGTGAADESGEGAGKGTTLNCPVPAGTGDGEIVRLFEERLKPAALAFRPDFVLISAGFDSHRDDPLGGLAMTPEGFAELTRIVRAIAAETCGGRVASVLEGGYDMDGLARSVESHLRILME